MVQNVETTWINMSLQLHKRTKIYRSPGLYWMKFFVWANRGKGLFIRKPIVAQDIWLVAWIHLFSWLRIIEISFSLILVLKFLLIAGEGKFNPNPKVYTAPITE